MKKIIVILFLSLIVPAWAPVWAVETIPLSPEKMDTYNELCGQFACQCGCGATIAACPHEYCSFAIPFRKEIVRLLNEDKTTAEITDYFVEEHGEIIRSQPTFKGFNIMVWITPFVAILVVGYIIVTLIGEWAKRAGPAMAESKEGATPANRLKEDDPDLKRMRDELTKFDD